MRGPTSAGRTPLAVERSTIDLPYERNAASGRNKMERRAAVASARAAHTATTERGPPGHLKTIAQNAHRFHSELLSLSQRSLVVHHCANAGWWFASIRFVSAEPGPENRLPLTPKRANLDNSFSPILAPRGTAALYRG